MGILGSVLGIVVLLIIAVLFSNNRKAINLRTVLGALAIQIGFAALILYVPFGHDALQATAMVYQMLSPMVMKGLTSSLVA